MDEDGQQMKLSTDKRTKMQKINRPRSQSYTLKIRNIHFTSTSIYSAFQDLWVFQNINMNNIYTPAE